MLDSFQLNGNTVEIHLQTKMLEQVFTCSVINKRTGKHRSKDCYILLTLWPSCKSKIGLDSHKRRYRPSNTTD